MAEFYYKLKACVHKLSYKKNPLFYQNLYQCTSVELLSSRTLFRQYFPVCSNLNYTTSILNFGHHTAQIRRKTCDERM